jgi:hypothetical protein
VETDRADTGPKGAGGIRPPVGRTVSGRFVRRARWRNSGT